MVKRNKSNFWRSRPGQLQLNSKNIISGIFRKDQPKCDQSEEIKKTRWEEKCNYKEMIHWKFTNYLFFKTFFGFDSSVSIVGTFNSSTYFRFIYIKSYIYSSESFINI